MQEAEKPPVTKDITDFVSNTPEICKEVAFDGVFCFLFHITFNSVGEKHQMSRYRT